MSFASTHKKEVGESIQVDGIRQELWPVHCLQNTHGASLVKELNKDHIDRYFHKGIDHGVDSYSAFFDNDKERETGLENYLRQVEVTKLYIAGLTTDFCVKYSTLDALELGYEVVVIADACRPCLRGKGSIRRDEKGGGKDYKGVSSGSSTHLFRFVSALNNDNLRLSNVISFRKESNERLVGLSFLWNCSETYFQNLSIPPHNFILTCFRSNFDLYFQLDTWLRLFITLRHDEFLLPTLSSILPSLLLKATGLLYSSTI